MGEVPFTYAAEVFPLENRMTGMSFSVFSNFLGAGLLTMFVPILTAKLGHAWLLGIFAVLNAAAFILVFFLVPETAAAAVERKEGSMNSVQLEQLNYIFGVTPGRHAWFQLTTLPPFLVKYVSWAIVYTWTALSRGDLDDLDEPRMERLYRWSEKRDRARELRELEPKDAANVQVQQIESVED